MINEFGDLQTTQIPITSEKFQKIEQYLLTTHGPTHFFQMQVLAIHEINTKLPCSDIGNKKLLWHGTDLSNISGICAEGLKIAPNGVCLHPNGHMFGRGIYFTDCSSKAAQYSFYSRKYKRTFSTGYVLLAEVSLGKESKMIDACYTAEQYLIAQGYDSVAAAGRYIPSNAEIFDGVHLPMGPLITPSNNSRHTLYYNEYVVYKEDQIRLRYLVELSFN